MTEESTQQSSNTEGGPPMRHRKRKNGLVSRLKKFGSQGKLGRGFEINSDTYHYFLRVFELCNKNEFETEEERDLFVDNAFVQTENEEVHLSSNQFTSRVLETLINLTKNEEILNRFTCSFTPSLRTVCTDPYASHVLEKLLEVIPQKWAGNKKLVKWFRGTSKYIVNNFEEFVFEKYANHCMRKVCQCLSGSVHLFSSKTQQHNASSTRLPLPPVVKPMPIDFEGDDSRLKFDKKNRKLLRDFASQFINWPQLGDLLQNEVTSGFVQTLLVTLRVIDDDMAIQGVMKVKNTIVTDQVLGFPCHLRSLEVCVSIASDEPTVFESIYEKYLKGRMLQHVTSEDGHYLIERVFQAVPTKEIFEQMFEELEPNFQNIYDTKYLSVITSMAEGCKRLKCKQNVLTTKLSEILGAERIAKNENFFEVLLRFGKTFPPKDDGTISFITELQGCITTQHILHFHKPYKIITAVLDMDGSKLSKIASDPKGSYVMDAFFSSDTVGEKNKEKLLLKLKEYFVTMACTKFGARVLDNLFPLSNVKHKELIASALAPREAQLNANSFGKFLAIKYGLAAYKRNPSEWSRAIEGSGDKKRKKVMNRLISDLGLDLGEISGLKKLKKN